MDKENTISQTHTAPSLTGRAGGGSTSTQIHTAPSLTGRVRGGSLRVRGGSLHFSLFTLSLFTLHSLLLSSCTSSPRSSHPDVDSIFTDTFPSAAAILEHDDIYAPVDTAAVDSLLMDSLIMDSTVQPRAVLTFDSIPADTALRLEEPEI